MVFALFTAPKKFLLRFKKKYGAVTEVEIDEMLCFCRFLLALFPRSFFFHGAPIPCVTKLPKFRPTMQCHVAPARESNYGESKSVLLLLARHRALIASEHVTVENDLDT